MCAESFEPKNFFLDQILAERRCYRIFTPEVPPVDTIERILYAGLLAPYAEAAVGSFADYFRRFFVLKNGSESLKASLPLVMAEVEMMERDLLKAMEENLELKRGAVFFLQRLSAIRKLGKVPGIGTALYYIVVAERKGFPPVALQSLAHCLENMWLKATALSLGFQIVSITSRLSSVPEFCDILRIRPNEWEPMGCAIGYPLD